MDPSRDHLNEPAHSTVQPGQARGRPHDPKVEVEPSAPGEELASVARRRETPPAAPPIVGDVVAEPGRPLDDGARRSLEPDAGTSLDDVRIHTDDRAASSALAVGAAAYTVGSDVVFGPGRYAPGTQAGDRLLAHEVGHVAQNRGRSPTLLHRSVESDAARIESLLSYGLFDWVITDAEAIEALDILSNQPPELQKSLVRRINVGRLRDNLPKTHQPILEKILTQVGEAPPPVASTVSKIQDLLSYGLFDWAITDADAREALRLLKALSPAEQKRVVLVINYQRLYDNLPADAEKKELEAIRKPAAAVETAETQKMDALRTRAHGIVQKMKQRADVMPLPVPPATGKFERFVGDEYLKDYCADPGSKTAGKAIDEMTLVGSGGFTHYGFGLLRDLAERADTKRGIAFIDTPFLLGTPAPGAVGATGLFDPWSQGPNATQLMHFAAGIKWSWAPAALVQWYFVHYEKVSEEGWQIFGLDSLNDIIAEEGGRLFAEDLKSGKASCSGGFVDLDPYFERGRAFLRSQLSESKLDELALRVHLQNLVVVVDTAGGVLSETLYDKTIMEQLIAGASDLSVLNSPDGKILTLLYRLVRRG